MEPMHKKILIGAAIVVALLAGYRFGNDKGIIGMSIEEERAAGNCWADMASLSLKASSTDFATDEAVVAAVFDNLMGGYADMRGCREVYITDYALESVSVSTSTERNIVADITYGVEPGNILRTAWFKAGARDGFWVRGIPATLNIYRTGDGFFLSF